MPASGVVEGLEVVKMANLTSCRVVWRLPVEKRNGTATLFAALEVATGKVTDACYDRLGKAEFLEFIKKVARAYPRRQLHVVVDNHHTYKHEETNIWLAKTPGHAALHPDLRVLAEPGRGPLRHHHPAGDPARPSLTLEGSATRSAGSSTAGTSAATRSSGPRPLTRSCRTQGGSEF